VHLTALVEHPEHVCCRYRLAAYQSFFERAGHRLDFLPLPRRWWSRLWRTAALKFDVAILQRRLLSKPELSLLRRNTRHLVFDFDDALWLRDSYAARGLTSGRRLTRFESTIQAADVVIAGNEFLAAQAQQFAEPRRVVVIPTCINPDLCPRSHHGPRQADVRLAWVGSSSTLRGLERFAGTLEALGREVPGIRLKLICDRFFSLSHLAVERCGWNWATEAFEIAASDIGIAWMPDDDWSRGKCGLKVLQYMAAGLPVVANPVGVHVEMIRHGETGLLATTPEEWISAIRRLASDAALRARMGEAGRHVVETRYSVARGAERWLDVWDRVETRRKAA
jgi:glycosyltransferase involved in cell wall biosynthesis